MRSHFTSQTWGAGISEESVFIGLNSMSDRSFGSHFSKVPNPHSNKCSSNRYSTHSPSNHRPTAALSTAIFAIGSGISLITQAQEILRFDVETASSGALIPVLTPEAARGDGDIEIHPDPILRNLAIRRCHAQVSPINARITGAMLQHHPQRLAPFWVVGAARAAMQRSRALRQLPAQIAGAVARGVALLREAVAEDGLRLHDHVVAAAVEEEVVVLRREAEVRAGVQAESSGGAEGGAVAAVPHGRVGDEDVGVGVADVADRVFTGGSSELQVAGVGADEDVAVIRAAAAVVDAEGVVDRDLAAGASALAGCGLCE